MRSPNYPAMSLPNAITAAESIYRSHQRKTITDEEVAQALGYKGLSGPSRTKLSALKKYGILDRNANGWRLTDRAMQIIHKPVDSPDHQQALVDAVRDVELFNQLLETHTHASEATLKSYLLADLNFTKEGAENAAKAFSETKALVEQWIDDIMSLQQPVGSNTQPPRQVAETSQPMVANVIQSPAHGVKQEVFAVERGHIIVQWPDGLTKPEVDDVCEWLDLLQKKIVRSVRVTDESE